MTSWNRQLLKLIQDKKTRAEHPELRKRLQRLEDELSETPLLTDDEFDEIEKRVNGISC